MSNYWKFYLPDAHPTGLYEQVGGGIGSEELKPQLGALFSYMTTDSSSTKTQYRKVFAKQVKEGSFENVLVEVDNVEHTGQISFYVGDYTGYAPTALTVPDVLEAGFFSGNATTPMTGLTSSTVNSTIPIWFKQTLEPGIDDDDLASFTIKIIANKIG